LSIRGAYFLPERLPELRKAIFENRAKNWRHIAAIMPRPRNQTDFGASGDQY
jgi:hypothetical protein